MQRILRSLLPLLFAAPILLPPRAQAATCNGISLGQNASLNGFVPFPSTDPWRKDVSNAAIDGNSDAIIAAIGNTRPVHPDFGSGLWDNSTIGIPYQVVSGTGFVNIGYTAYGSESDPGPMPVPRNALIEGYPQAGGAGDKHVLVIDRDNCWLYELYNARLQSNGSWDADSGSVWDLLNNNQRPYTWTSADAAGLPIFPGLARYDEVASGAIHHALRFTLASSKAAVIPPAKHWAANSSSVYAAPLGMRLRLRPDFDLSSFPPQTRIILTALKRYGMIVADNGSSMFISGAPSSGWNNDDLHALGKVTAADFQVIQENPVYTSSRLPSGAAPTISRFVASSGTISRGSSTTLSWSGSGASYYVVSPGVGAVRGTSVTVKPSATTRYTLYSTNAYDRKTATVQVTVR